jgi:hypothetical protein
VKPATEYYELSWLNRYRRDYEVIADLTDVLINKAGFSKNIFNENKYIITVNNEIDLTDVFDGLGLPITELYLYCEYQPADSDNGDEVILKKEYTSGAGNTSTYNEFTPTELVKGDIIDGDVIIFDVEVFNVEEYNLMDYKIYTYFDDVGRIVWKYRPFIPITINIFSDDIEKESIQGNSYDDISRIPDYAKPLSDGNNTYIWREILDKGIEDPLLENGLFFPFINNKHYVFNNFILVINPDNDDSNTSNTFNEIILGASSNIGSIPIDNTEDFGKPCK